MSRLAQAGKWRELWEVLRDLKNVPFPPEDQKSLTELLGKRNDSEYKK
jgi:hypothetical protein